MSEQFQFNLLENAFDYVLSAAEHVSEDSPRSWKYSILHLVAGIELLVKARLEQEHWSLLFAHVDQASEDTLRSGDFISVDFDTACRRLQNIANVDIDRSAMDHLIGLRKLRNRIQHFDFNLDLELVKSLVAKGVSFVVSFCQSELEVEMGADGEIILEKIHRHLKGFDEFVADRLEAIGPELQDWLAIECGECWQETLVIGDGDPRCRFCSYEISSERLASNMSEGVVRMCPVCYQATLAFILYNNEEGGWFCTGCGERRNDDYEECGKCGEFMLGQGMFCESCTDWIAAKG